MKSLKDIEHKRDLIILGEHIALGESKKLNFNFARLFTDTIVEIPVFIERSKIPGPTVLITAGIHGDEVNGIEIVREVISHKMNIPARGTIICVPIVNVFGFINRSRFFPDGRDLNRMFPGSKTGSLASRFANHFVNNLLEKADLCMDFHTGGGERFNAAQVRIEPGDAQLEELAEVFNAPFTIYQKCIKGSFRDTCKKRGIPILLNESGKTMALHKDLCKEATDGIARVLNHLGMLRPKMKVPPKTHANIKINQSGWIRAQYSGFLHVKVCVQDFVEKGDVIATLSDPYGQKSFTVKAPAEGYIININQSPMVFQGDAIFHIARTTAPPTVTHIEKI